MKKYLSALVAMCMFLIAVAAHGAPAPATTTPAAAVSAVDRLMLNRQAKAEADIEMLKANAAESGKSADYDKIVAAVKAEQQAKAKIANSRYYKLREEAKTDRKKLDELVKLVSDLGLLKKADREQLANMAQKLGEIESKVDGIETRVTGVEKRQNATDDSVVRIERKVDEVVATQWRSQLRLGVETGRDIATSSTNAVVGFGSTLQSGYGWYSALSLGLGDVLVAPHPTSAAFRAGVTSTIGSANSPLSAQFGLLVGVAAKESLALDAGVAVGANVGLTYKPRGWPVGFTASAGQVFGRFEGFVVHAGAFFDPLSLGDLGK